MTAVAHPSRLGVDSVLHRAAILQISAPGYSASASASEPIDAERLIAALPLFVDSFQRLLDNGLQIDRPDHPEFRELVLLD